jgi:branched-chain amino acid transport system substrate-binding protein
MRGIFRFRRTALLWLLAAAAVAACGGGGDDTPQASPTAATGPSGDAIVVARGQKLRIGVSTTMTTEQAQFGVPIANAARLAAAQRQSVHGFELEVLVEDDACTGPGAEAVAERLIAATAAAVIGPMCASGAVAALDDYGDAGVPVVSSSASHASVTEQGAEHFVRTIWSDSTEGEEIAKYVVEALGLRRIALIDDESPGAESVIGAAESSFRTLGTEVASREQVQRGAPPAATVARIVGANAEIVIFGGSADTGAPLARALREAGFTGSVLGAASETTDAPWTAIEGAYVSMGPAPTSSTFEALLPAYRAMYGDEAGTAYIEYAYDAMQIVLNAIERVGVVGADGVLTISREGLMNEIRQSRLENGASGSVAFKPNGDRDISVGAVNAVFQVRGGSFVRVQ